MPLSSIAQYNRLKQRGPSYLVNMIDTNICLQKFPDDFNVSAVGCPDKAGSVVTVRTMYIRPGFNQHIDNIEMVVISGSHKGASAFPVLRVDINIFLQ